MDRQGNYAEWKKPVPKDYILGYSVYITFLTWQHARNGEQVSGYQGLGDSQVGECSYKRATQGIIAI